jgi:uncharacterized damage-inducible protein DinB
MPIKDALLSEYDHEMATTRKLLARLPDEKLRWRPHEKSRSLGDLAIHLANLPQWTQAILDKSSFDLDQAPPAAGEATSGAAVLGAFDQCAARARTFLDRTDAEYLAPWTLNRGGQQMFTLPRVAAFRAFVLSHLIHHRGQLSVYLRLNDVPVPSIYGPSADEG